MNQRKGNPEQHLWQAVYECKRVTAISQKNDQKGKNAIKKEKRANQTEEQKEAIKKKDREQKAKQKEAMTEEERGAAKKNDKEQKAKQRTAKGTPLMENGIDEDNGEEERLSDKDDEEELLSEKTISKAMAEALKYLHQTHIKGTN